MRLGLLLKAGVLGIACGVVLAADMAPQPKIEPGYQPVDAGTEKGLWMELGEYERRIRRSALLVKDEAINEYVQDVACRVTGEYCQDLRVYIIRNPGFNASMTANGIMQVWTGLLVRVESEDQLAAVLGHELAHYTQLHSLDRLRRIKSGMASSSVIDLLIGLPIAQMATIASIMSFSREQEQEADLLGVKFMRDAGYDPRAASEVWQMVVAEEKSAVAKSREPGVFSKTHPSSADRIDVLDSFIEQSYPDLSSSAQARDRHVAILNQYYLLLMEDQIDTNRFGRTENILQTHRQIGVDPGLIEFFHGEMYRQRNGEGDIELAKQAYELSILTGKPVADAYKNLGYINLKQGDRASAATNFRQYLELKPDASDRAMIEFYIEE